jgi:hypothetical protein
MTDIALDFSSTQARIVTRDELIEAVKKLPITTVLSD